VIEVNAENRLAMFKRADGWLYTHEHQAQFYTGDDGFSLLAAQETKTLQWGGKTVRDFIRTPKTGRVPVRRR